MKGARKLTDNEVALLASSLRFAQGQAFCGRYVVRDRTLFILGLSSKTIKRNTANHLEYDLLRARKASTFGG